MTDPAGQRFLTPDILRMFPSFVWKARLKPEIHGPTNESLLRTLGGRASLDLANIKGRESA